MMACSSRSRRQKNHSKWGKKSSEKGKWQMKGENEPIFLPKPISACYKLVISNPFSHLYYLSFGFFANYRRLLKELLTFFSQDDLFMQEHMKQNKQTLSFFELIKI
jgi:hypothetical protein